MKWKSATTTQNDDWSYLFVTFESRLATLVGKLQGVLRGKSQHELVGELQGGLLGNLRGELRGELLGEKYVGGGGLGILSSKKS